MGQLLLHRPHRPPRCVGSAQRTAAREAHPRLDLRLDLLVRANDPQMKGRGPIGRITLHGRGRITHRARVADGGLPVRRLFRDEAEMATVAAFARPAAGVGVAMIAPPRRRRLAGMDIMRQPGLAHVRRQMKVPQPQAVAVGEHRDLDDIVLLPDVGNRAGPIDVSRPAKALATQLEVFLEGTRDPIRRDGRQWAVRLRLPFAPDIDLEPIGLALLALATAGEEPQPRRRVR